MFQQLVQRMVAPSIRTRDQAAATVLGADPFDLLLHMEQVWNTYNPWSPNAAPAGRAREALFSTGAFNIFNQSDGLPVWDHLGYSYVIENTRAVQILRRVVREYRSGEGLGVPSVATQRWLDATEVLLFGEAHPVLSWLPKSTVRPDPEAVRRNAYWRLFGLDLAFGTDDNRPPTYDKASAANTGFLPLFEELLFELWQAITNVRNTSGVNASDDDRIYRLAEQLQFVLRSRRQFNLLAREEFAAAAVLSWVDLTLSADTPVVLDLRAQATSAADRLKIIGERVNLMPHSKSAALFSMSADFSIFLRTIESGVVTEPSYAWVLYLSQKPAGSALNDPDPIGDESRRVITEWAAATGKNLKERAKPLELNRDRRQLIAAR
jgi:hypothetical protein